MGVITAYRQTLFLDLKREMPRQCHLFSDHTSQFGTQRRIRDPRILCNRAFDVRQSGEQAFAQALFAIHFFGRKTEYAGTPLTPTKPTARRRTDIHENSNSASFYRGNIFPLYAFIPPYLKALPNIADAATYHVAILCNPLHPLASQRLVRSKPHH